MRENRMSRQKAAHTSYYSIIRTYVHIVLHITYIMSIVSNSVSSGTVSPRMEDNNCTIPSIAFSYVRMYI